MKKNLFKITLVLLALIPLKHASAQLLLPAPSPKAMVMQTVGLTEITIDYSSPAVNGRTIWGDLVPYDKPWRAGANSATKITFSKDVTIGTTAVPKGSYSILIIPSKTDWTIILNKDASVSAEEYKQEMDMVRIMATPMMDPICVMTAAGAGTPIMRSTERLTYYFSDFNNEMGTINMVWEKYRVSFTVKVGTDKQAAENIDKAVNGAWGIYNNSARYYFDKKEYDKALEYANQSIAISDQWFNNWVKAQILAAKGMNEDAYFHASKAKELGDKNPKGFFFKDQVEKSLVDWAAYAPKPKKKGK